MSNVDLGNFRIFQPNLPAKTRLDSSAGFALAPMLKPLRGPGLHPGYGLSF
jgi:hypothetical protein